MKELFTVIYCFRFTYCFCSPGHFVVTKIIRQATSPG